MKKFLFFAIIFLFFAHPATASASLVVVGKDGDVTLNVLASHDENGVVQEDSEKGNGDLGLQNILLSLSKKDDKSYLSLGLPSGDRVLDVTDYNGDIIEVEGDSAPQKLTIAKKDGKFSLSQDGLNVITDYNVEMDSKEKKLLVATPTGKKFLLVFPQEAAFSLLRSNLVSKIDKSQEINMVEDNGDLAYEIVGKKFFQIFGLFGFNVDVATRVSATTGQVLAIVSPSWMKVASFAFI